MPIRRTLSLLAVALTASVGVGCSDSTGLPAALNGTWEHFSPAMSYTMTLATQGNAVAGSGQWFGEACCAGPISVHGAVTDGRVTLDLDFTATEGGLQVPPFSQHFEGRLVRADSLAGILSAGDQRIEFGYRRAQ